MAQHALIAVLAAFLWTATAFAHHPFSEEFDTSKTVTLMGTVTTVEWTNPHVFAYVDVKDNEGKLVNWKVEMGGPSSLEREGWTRTSVKTGDQVTIKGWAARRWRRYRLSTARRQVRRREMLTRSNRRQAPQVLRPKACQQPQARWRSTSRSVRFRFSAR